MFRLVRFINPNKVSLLFSLFIIEYRMCVRLHVYVCVCVLCYCFFRVRIVEARMIKARLMFNVCLIVVVVVSMGFN